MRFILTWVLVLTSHLPCLAEVPQLAAGDRVVFVGDSITHGGRYHADVYLFYATRYPDRPFALYNCGIAGDITPGTNQRFDIDVAVHQPNVAAIMLGINDAWSWCYDAAWPTEKMLQGRKAAHAIYVREMDRLVRAFQALGVRVIVITPSIYDQTAKLSVKNLLARAISSGHLLTTYASKYHNMVERSSTSTG